MAGCARTVAFLLGLIIVGSVLWAVTRPHSVGYDDRVNADNVNTFEKYHTWGDSFTEAGNTELAAQAIKRLGTQAYGWNYGKLMDQQRALNNPVVESTPRPAPADVPNPARPILQVGDEATIDDGTPLHLLCLPSLDDWDDLIQATIRKDYFGVSEVQERGHALYDHTRILVLGTHPVHDVNEVRLESGAFAGDRCFMSAKAAITNYVKASDR